MDVVVRAAVSRASGVARGAPLCRDHSRRVAAVAAEDGDRLRAAARQVSLPEVLRPWLPAATDNNLLALLLLFVISGVVLHTLNHFVSAYATQVQVDTGQRMVYDLRYRLFDHLQALNLHHHIKTSTSDAVYRVDVDAYSIENLVMSGLFPLATSVVSLLVMFGILVKLDLTIALLSLTVVPFLYLCLRYYMSTLVTPGGAGQRAGIEADGPTLRDVLGDAAGQELRTRALRGGPLREGRQRNDARAHRGHLAAVAVLRDHRPHHVARDGARA